MSVSFYENHKQMQQAFVQPFQGEVQTDAKDEARRKMMRLLGNKKKMHQLEKSQKNVIFDKSDQKGKFKDYC